MLMGLATRRVLPLVPLGLARTREWGATPAQAGGRGGHPLLEGDPSNSPGSVLWLHAACFVLASPAPQGAEGPPTEWWGVILTTMLLRREKFDFLLS